MTIVWSILTLLLQWVSPAPPKFSASIIWKQNIYPGLHNRQGLCLCGTMFQVQFYFESPCCQLRPNTSFRSKKSAIFSIDDLAPARRGVGLMVCFVPNRSDQGAQPLAGAGDEVGHAVRASGRHLAGSDPEEGHTQAHRRRLQEPIPTSNPPSHSPPPSSATSQRKSSFLVASGSPIPPIQKQGCAAINALWGSELWHGHEHLRTSCRIFSVQTLLAEQGPAYELNLRVFTHLQSTFTEWPAGAPSQASPQNPLHTCPV